MDIWEPCNYVSNLAYDRLLVEICVQQVMRIDSFRNPGNNFTLLENPPCLSLFLPFSGMSR